MSLNRLLSYLTTPIGLLGSFSYLALLFLYIRATRRIPKTGFGIKPVKGFGSHPEPDGLDLVFVHGLGSNPDTTWTARDAAGKDVCWITDWLPNDIPENIRKNLRVFFYNHDTFWQKNAVQSRLPNLGRGLLDHLSTVRRNDEEQSRGLIFIGHSYGGLLIKEALKLAHNDTTFEDVAHNTKAILFLGTPHQGSDFAYWGTVIASALRPLGSNPGILRELRYDMTSLLDLHRDFVKGAGRHLEVINFFEEKESVFQLWGISLWRAICVPESSATYELNNLTRPIALSVDHYGLNKFSTPDSNYKLICHNLIRIIENINISTLKKRETSPVHRFTEISRQSQSIRDGLGLSSGTHWSSPSNNVATPEIMAPIQEGQNGSIGARDQRLLSVHNLQIPLDDKKKSTLSRYSNQDFTGRVEHLRKIEELFRLSKPKDKRVVLWGLGGIGKSQIAFEYAQSCANGLSTFWIKGDTMEHAAAGYLAIARKLKPGFEPPRSIEDSLRMTCELLEAEEVCPWILVLDEVDHTVKTLRDYIPRTERGKILFTTRDHRVVGMDHIVLANHGINVSAMTVSEGVELLRKKVPPQVLQKSHPTEHDKFIELLGGLPLAIIQAAAYIREVPGTSIRSFYERYKQIDDHDELFGNSATSADLEQKSVLYTWEISYAHIVGPGGPTSKSVAAQVLDLLGFIDSKDTITRNLSEAEQALQYFDEDAEILSWLRPHLGPQSDPTVILQRIWRSRIMSEGDRIEDLQRAIGMLDNYSLVTSRRCWIHPIVHDWSYRRLPPTQRHNYLTWIIAELLDQIDDPTPVEGSWWGHLNHRLDTPLHSLEYLSVLRNAKTTLTLAMSPIMIDYRKHHCSSIPDLIKFLFLLGDRCFHLSRIDEARRYLDQCIVEAETDNSVQARMILLQARLLRAKIEAVKVDPHRTTSMAQELIATAKELFSHNPASREMESSQLNLPDVCLQTMLWFAECLANEGLHSEALQAIENMIESCSVSTLADHENFKSLIVGKWLAATWIAENKDETNRSRAKAYLYEILRFIDLSTSENAALLLPTLVWKTQLQLLDTDEERYQLCRNLVSYERRASVWKDSRLFGGNPAEWVGFLGQLARQERWIELEAFAIVYTSNQHDIRGIIQNRHANAERFKESQEMLRYWIKMRVLLANAYKMLGRREPAEEQLRIAFMQMVILLPHDVAQPSREFKELVYAWAVSLCHVINTNGISTTNTYATFLEATPPVCSAPMTIIDLRPPPESFLRRLRISYANILIEAEAERGPLPIAIE